MKLARGVDEPAGERPDRRLHRRAGDRLRRQFSTPFPSQVFLTMFGLPMDDLPTFLEDEGRRHPARPGRRPRVRPPRDRGATNRRPPTRSTRTSSGCSTSEPGTVRDDLLSHFLHAEVDGDRLTHEEILDICFLFLIAGLDTVTASLDCFFGYLAAAPRRPPQDRRGARRRSRRSSRSCCAGRRRSWGAPGSPPATPRSTASPISEGEQVMVAPRRRQRRRGRVHQAAARSIWDRDGQPAPRLRRRGPPLPRLPPGPPRAPRGAAGVAPPDPRLLDQARRRARLHRGHPHDSTTFPMVLGTGRDRAA